MGYFSWLTQDTDKSIANQDSCRQTFPVYMTDDKGNRWREDNYEGYGRFGGKDYYELLAEMNGGPSDRREGIKMAFEENHAGNNPNVKHPNLTEDPNWVWRNAIPKSCREQGYFYEDKEDAYDEEGEYFGMA